MAAGLATFALQAAESGRVLGIQVDPVAEVRERFRASIGQPELLHPSTRLTLAGARDGDEVLSLAPPLLAEAEATHAFLHGFPNTVMARATGTSAAVRRRAAR